jgi:hypothetical protein
VPAVPLKSFLRVDETTSYRYLTPEDHQFTDDYRGVHPLPLIKLFRTPTFMGQIRPAVISEEFCKDFIVGVDVTVTICEHPPLFPV